MPRTERSRSARDRRGDRLDTGRKCRERFVEKADGLITASRRRDEALGIDARGYDALVGARPLECRERAPVQRVARVEPGDHDARI